MRSAIFIRWSGLYTKLDELIEKLTQFVNQRSSTPPTSERDRSIEGDLDNLVHLACQIRSLLEVKLEQEKQD